MFMLRLSCIACLSWLLLACSTTPAPVIDRTPAGTASTPSGKTSTAASTTKAASKTPAKPVNGKNGSDWRPDTHTVKKGDTLFSIGLEYGYDYKDIARVNNIAAPYVIKIGQVLNLAELKLTEPKDKAAALETKPAQTTEDGVMTYPLNTEGGVTPTTAASKQAATTSTATIIAISEPKAIREPYSDEAFKTALPAAKPVTPPVTAAKATTEAKPPVAETKETKPEAKETAAESKPEPKPAAETAGGITWSWPTKGKVISGFNEGGNKGIDIAGTKGQPILAAAPGKVIYSGSDLRGYGKLVIIKHNNTYLSVYANNSNIVVKEGQQVSAGQKIAEMGDTDSNVVKLHFEIRQQGKSVDPAKFLAAN